MFVQSVALAKDYSFRRYGQKDGLPILRVDCAMQDHRGFMWFGTNQWGTKREPDTVVQVTGSR